MKQFQYSAALVASVLALGAFAHDARANLITYTQITSDFSTLPASVTNLAPTSSTGTVLLDQTGSW